jgi:DNA polymerase-1
MDKFGGLMVLDVSNLVHRQWWGSRASRTSAGRDNSLEAGFLNYLRSLMRRCPRARPVLAWDGEPVRQLAENPGYKAHRAAAHADRPADWHPRCDRLREALAHLLPTLFDPADEADVEIARFLKQQAEAESVLVSTDGDLHALLRDGVSVLRPGQDAQLYRADDFRRDYGFPPERLALYKSLTGDRSDGVRGLPYFLKKTAARLAAAFADAHALYESLHAGRLEEVAGELRGSEVEKLRAGEAAVRSNARLFDLLAAGGAPHLSHPDGDAGPLSALARGLELAHLVWTESGKQDAGCADQRPQPEAAEARPFSAPLVVSPAWADRLAKSRRSGREAEKPVRIIPAAPPRSRSLTEVKDAGGMRRLLELARQRPVAFVGFDTEFSHDRPGVTIKKGKTAYDPGSIRPLLLSLDLAEPGERGGLSCYPFVIDLRAGEVLPSLAELLRLPLCFVGHHAQAELLCLLRLGLPLPATIWDTCVCEKALHMGRSHKKYKLKRGADDADGARAGEQAEEEDELSYKLAPTCQRYGVTHPFAGDKERLQRSFLEHPPDAPFTREQIEYAASDARAAAAVYQPQLRAAAQAGILQHLVTVEMPWVVTNARMHAVGVLKDGQLCRRVERAARESLDSLRADLARHGVANDGFVELKKFFEARGLLHLFRRDGKVSFDKQMLEEFQDHHPVIPVLRAIRRINTLLESRILTDDFVGAGGRVHANFVQLGTHTGRQSSWGPNLLGLGRVFRPLIVAPPGRGLGEADLSQIEVGVAAAVYGDDHLVELFNTGDVYSGMAQHFYRAELSEADRAMAGKDFKKQHGKLRAKMKVCTLSLIYGVTPHGLALRLKTSESEAAALLGRFMGMFPSLKRALAETPAFGSLCGYVTTVSGLRRHRARRHGPLSNWERNWMTNHPVQGSAAVVFKHAGNRLDKLYRRHDARLLVPLHDAFLFEAPLKALGEVAGLTGRALCEAVQEYFPSLRPQVDVNVEHPASWTKDGRFDSVERWLEDPTFTF